MRQGKSPNHPLSESLVLACASGVALALSGLLPEPFLRIPEMQPWSALVGLAWWLRRADCWWHEIRLWHRWHILRSWTPTPQALMRSIPPETFCLGKGFAWVPIHTQALQHWQRRRQLLPRTKHPRGGSPALHGVGALDEESICIPSRTLTRHMSIQGSTGSGKSMLLRVLVSNAIRHTDGPLVVIDPKGKGNLVGHAIVEAHATGRPFALLCPYFPDLSARFDPLSTCSSALEVTERIRSLLPPSQDPFWINFPLAALHLTALMMERLGEPWTLPALHAQTLLLDKRQRLAARYLRKLGMPNVPTGAVSSATLKEAYAALGREDDVLPWVFENFDASPQWYGQVTSNLRAGLSGIVDTDYTRLFVERPALTWQQIDEEKMVVVIHTASMLLREAGNKFGRLILQDLMGYIGQRYQFSSLKTDRPITVLVDETSEVVYPDFVQQVNKGGEAGARFVLAWQSQADLVLRLGRDASQQLRDNLETRIWLRMADEETSQKVSEGAPKGELMTGSETRLLDYGKGDGHSMRASMVRDYKEQELLDSAWFSQLPQGEGFARIGGTYYKLRVPLLPPPDETLIARMGYGQVVGALNATEKTP